MRVAHRHRAEAQRLAVEFNRVFIVRGIEAGRGREARHAHRDAVVMQVEHLHGVGAGGAVEFEVAGEAAFGVDLRTVAQHPGGDAARAVAALLRRRAVGIPDAV